MGKEGVLLFPPFPFLARPFILKKKAMSFSDSMIGNEFSPSFRVEKYVFHPFELYNLNTS